MLPTHRRRLRPAGRRLSRRSSAPNLRQSSIWLHFLLSLIKVCFIPKCTNAADGSDIPLSMTVKHRPTAFLTSPLPYGTDGMSSHQLAQYLSLLLGLPLPSLPTPDGLCNCRAPLSAFGYHQLTCSKWAGRSWKKGHDIVANALIC